MEPNTIRNSLHTCRTKCEALARCGAYGKIVLKRYMRAYQAVIICDWPAVNKPVTNCNCPELRKRNNCGST